MELKTPFQIPGDRKDPEKAQHTIDQRHIEIDESIGNVGVEHDKRYGNNGEHVDRRNAVNGGPAQNETYDAEQDAKEDQDCGKDQYAISQKSSPIVPRRDQQSGGLPGLCRSFAGRGNEQTGCHRRYLKNQSRKL